MNTIPQYCQRCREKNELGEATCRRCGTRLMLVVFPQSLKFDTNYVPTYYEDHLLERVTSLELRLSQVAERLATTLDLMLRQTKSAHSDHVLLETLIESLNTLGAVEKDNLTKNWRERLDAEESKDKAKKRREELLAKILKKHGKENDDLFAHLINEGIKFFSEDEEKQGLRTLERALLLSPKNTPLLMFISEKLFSVDKFELAKSYLEKILAISPKEPKALLLLSVINAEEGNVAGAEELAKKFSGNKKTAFCEQYVSGMLAAFEGNWTAAVSFFKELLLAKSSPETHYLLGCAYVQAGKNKMAMRHLQKATLDDEKFTDAWYMLSVVYSLLDEPEKSHEAIEIAWTTREAGAQSLEFLKRKDAAGQTALPFLRLRNLQSRFLTGGASRLTRLFKEELFKIINV